MIIKTIKSISLAGLLFLSVPSVFAEGCCGSMGGINYCDSSAGRLVCQNGFYSTCYCTRHAVMDLQFLKGCCLWHGGVMSNVNAEGLVLCNDGSYSEECSLQKPIEKIAIY
ncbi:neurogenic locus notch [Legionella waltersii]|uniref:Neurogenic locus notch like protein n=1 Tax=Legionella waltersii TaxID=66969 RepID=A0A0W1ANC5_9GAMM|nr:neurogenic locus notch [Legionella waltersii]KTD82810.1 neurogenic locus notch like protein precursor [Legionella waltersii]SNV01491.1 neurogenic locus notch like protein precursor [Legionella waltersii]